MFGDFSAHGDTGHGMEGDGHSGGGENGTDTDRRVNDALTDLSAYALTLEGEYHRLERRLVELAGRESSADERRAILRERDEISEELDAFRRAVMALRDQILRRPPPRD
jgi:hypothetical protein